MKWLIAIVLTALLAWYVWHERHAVKSSYVNGLPQYNMLPGREYVFQRDCYIFKYKDRNTDWPLVGSAATVPGLPAEVTEKNVEAPLPDLRILDVVRTGARFRLVSVRRDESRAGTHVTFEILFLDEADRKYPRLDAFPMLNHPADKDGGVPSIREDYAVPHTAN